MQATQKITTGTQD